MTDLEMTKLCAEAMGYSVVKGDGRYKNGMAIATEDGDPVTNWDPLKHDAQAMALVKKFELEIIPRNDKWWVVTHTADDTARHNTHEMSPDLNRAIVECCAKAQVAKMQSGRAV